MSGAGVPTADVCILGAGPTGLSLAVALAARLPADKRIVVLDAGGPQRGDDDPRALALSHGSRQLLERLGAWPGSAATTIDEIHISQHDGLGIARLRAEELNLPALGYVVRYGDLLRALREAATGCVNLELRYATQLANKLEDCGDHAPLGLALSDGSRLGARWLAHAEGARDATDARHFDYRQAAIICEATPSSPVRRLAWERFTPEGPLALLPLGSRYAVILTVPAPCQDRYLDLDDRAFANELSRRLDGRLDFSQVTPRQAFPLALRWRTALHAGREIWLGNAAQTLHPISGQGFNLALRDAWTLSESLTATPADDAPASAILSRWARERQLDRLGGAGFTDGIVRLFSNHAPPLRLARGLGLSALNLLPSARAFIARRMIFGARAW